MTSLTCSRSASACSRVPDTRTTKSSAYAACGVMPRTARVALSGNGVLVCWSA